MKKEKETLNLSGEELNIIYKALANQKRFDILLYLTTVKYAPSNTLIRKLNLKNSLVSKSLKLLLKAKLITKVKICSSTIFSVNQDYKKFWFFD